MRADSLTLADIQRARGAKSLYQFVRYCWHIIEPDTAFVDNWHIGAICEHLQAVSAGQIRSLGINVPPGCMKSSLVSVFWPVWEWVNDPGLRFLFTSFDRSLTLRDAGKSRDIVLSDFFQARWGHRFALDEDDAQGDYATKKLDGTIAGGWRFSTSVGGKTLGRHPDRRVIDDPMKPKDVSKEALDKVINWWKTTMSTRARNPKTVATVLIMQRLAKRDLAGHLMDSDPDWDWVRLPMRYDPVLSLPTRLGKVDPRTEPGELLYPERFPEEVVKKLEITLGPRDASAQMQQNPTPEAGGVFELAWFSKRWLELPAESGMWVQSWDFTFKDTTGTDFVCGMVWLRVQANYYLVDIVYKRASFTASVQMVRDLTAKWPKALTKLVEDKANGPAVMDTLKDEIPGLVAVTPEGGKIARANAVTGLFQAGNVWLPQNHPLCQELVDTMTGFPFAAHDDMVDTTSQAVLWLSKQPAFTLEAAMTNAKKTGLLNLLGGR